MLYLYDPDNHHEKLNGVRLPVTDNLSEAKGILVLGGDGRMLQAIQLFHQSRKPFIGLNFGHLGFLMSEPNEDVIKEIVGGEINYINVEMLAVFLPGGERRLAFNDVWMEKASKNPVRIRISINGTVWFDPLCADGAIVATPAGSTAYSGSSGGVVVPIDTEGIVLTGISPMLFHYWRSSLLSKKSVIRFEAQETLKRPVRLCIDNREEILGVEDVQIRCSNEFVELGFAKSQDFQQKVLELQMPKM